jgi:amino acid transporter
MDDSEDQQPRRPRRENGDTGGRGGEPSFVRVERRGAARPDAADVGLHDTVRRTSQGAPVIRRFRPRDQKLRRVGEAEFEATRAALRPSTKAGRIWAAVRQVLVGPPLATEALPQERLSKLKALAVYASDNVSSAAYATEELLIILMLAGTGALHYSLPITGALIALVVIVVASYRQTIRAYPNGGGAYVVATENLGSLPGLLGGSALLVDYVMTVAVSIAAGVAAITSAAPDLYPIRVELALFFVALITVGNLRGMRESATIFAIPTYFFIISFASMVIYGLIRVALGAGLHSPEPANVLEPGGQAVTIFLLLRAFASGAVALSGIEAVANGVPSFKPPEWKNAITVQAWMATILAVFFAGTTILAHKFGVIPSETQTVAAQIARTLFGHNIFFYMIQAGTMLILVLAANTAFAGLPVLSSVMARDGKMPKQFMFRGERLAFSNGILVLGLASAGILVIFSANTTRIIPLYAFGVFTAFTLSQFGMVVHWLRTREPGWRQALPINAFGGIVTAAVAVIVGASKFTHGAWISMSIMLLLVVLLRAVHAHYQKASRLLGQGLLDGDQPLARRQIVNAPPRDVDHAVIIPVDEINQAVLRTAAYARSIGTHPTAVHVAFTHDEGEALRERWEEAVPDIPFVVVDSPYRSLTEPLLAYIDALRRGRPDQVVTVVLPEFFPRWPWERLLHNQIAGRLKKALLSRTDTVVVQVPFHFAE